MELLAKIALFFHLVGFASLFGVTAVQVRSPERIAKNGMMHGALTQLLTGPILAASEWDTINHTAAEMKLLVLIPIIAILAYYRRDPKRYIPARPFFTIFGLTFAEVIIAVAWL